MKFAICSLALFAALMCSANSADARVHRTPVRNLVRNTGKVIAAPFRNHSGCRCTKSGCRCN